MPYTDAQKAARKKWIEANIELHRERQNTYTKAYYQKNKEKRLAYAKEYRDKKAGKEPIEKIENL